MIELTMRVDHITNEHKSDMQCTILTLHVIRFEKQNKTSAKTMESRDANMAIEKCRRHDLYALRVFMALLVVKVSIYKAQGMYQEQFLVMNSTQRR